ncbi:MAG: hypothetical protein Fur0022_35390 [Anaerolineales bacterium]
MKTIELTHQTVTVEQLLDWASVENVVIRSSEKEFILALVEDSAFEAEVKSLGNNDSFISFLDKRAAEPKIPYETAKKRLLEEE